MKIIQKKNVRKTIEILQAGTKVIKNIDRAFHASRTGRLNGHALQCFKGGMDDADGLKVNVHFYIYSTNIQVFDVDAQRLK